MVNLKSFLKQLSSRKDRKGSKLSLSDTVQQTEKVERSSRDSDISLKIEAIAATIPTNTARLSKQNSINKDKNTPKHCIKRRYLGDEEISNKDEERVRLHKQHWLIKEMLQCNYHAPVTRMLEEGIVVLDSGCGPATWTFEMGETFPRSTFHGIDILCTFLETRVPPTNVELIVGDIAKHIGYPDNTFDYVHQRFLLSDLSSDDWENTLQELYRVLKPGGYIEIVEFDLYDIINMGPIWENFRNGTARMFNINGIPPRICSELEARLADTGFVNQVIKTTPLAFNHTSELGIEFWDNYKHGFLGIRPVMAIIDREWEDVKVYENYVDACGKEAKERETSGNHYSFCAQKPLK